MGEMCISVGINVLDSSDPSSNPMRHVATELAGWHMVVEKLVQFLQTASLKFRNEEIDEEDGDEGEGSIDESDKAAQVSWLVLDERVDVTDQKNADEAGRGRYAYGLFPQLSGGCLGGDDPYTRPPTSS